MTAHAQSVQTTGAWELMVDGPWARLYRPATEATLELEDVDPETVISVFERLAAGCHRREAMAELGRLGPRPASTLREFQLHQILRQKAPPGEVSVSGEGPLAAAVRSSIARHRWQLERSVVTFPALAWEAAVTAWTGDGLVLTRLDDTFLAASGCPGCLVLRALGRKLVRGQSVDGLGNREGEVPRALISELLMELERQRLEPGEGLWVEPGLIDRGAILPHPDCPGPHGAVDRGHGSVMAALRAEARPLEATAFETAAGRLVRSPFAPARLHELTTGLDQLPLGTPFVWGDTHLVRHLSQTTRCVSIEGIVHGGGSTAEECRRISVCEAVERLGAQSARPDVSLTRTVAEPKRALHDRWPGSPDAELPFCQGVDLLRDEPCLVPFERVVVGLSRELAPELGYHEPAFTGAATHLTLAEAIVNGTVEALKRDAFMVAWYRRRALRSIEWPRLDDPQLRARAEFLLARNFELELFDLTLDLPMPMLLLRVRAGEMRGSWPAGGSLLVPAGGFDPAESLGHALKLACTRVVSLCHESAMDFDPCDGAAVERLGERVPFWPPMARYLDPRTAGAHAFLGTGGRSTFDELPRWPLEPAPARMARLRGWLTEHRLAWTAVRLTDPAAASLGLEVVKVVMPGLMRLALSRESTDLGSPRLRLPLPDATTEAPNPDPHPLY
jgi:ribosomal protein S12 methylthiotransferase accessory factor